ncbi:hypothetical protein [Flavihumibacter sp. CACIAM 22H1]|uniref:hypothetical protein n=1 Tax=Flavihumibacter sp. CACIAM 22H1 TaxID=1812911 RepID=UPI0007A898A1|nr:hypothetical protein [Flavihumibacter sp. CACIAM 22H1]KYP13036.1 MAG: hypothetical protein A1D16_04850 [Flavihumibacter sp. CACIAM 22H1]
MNTRQFIAVIILFIGLVIFIVIQGNKNRERKRLQIILNEAIRIFRSNLEITGPAAVKAMQEKAASRGYSYEEMTALDTLYMIEQNGGIDQRSGAMIPGWIIKEYRKKYNKHD